MKMNAFNLRPIVVGILLLSTGISSAASVTLVGTDVNFTFDDTLMGLFGSPNVTGNTIFFTPNDFRSISTNRNGTVLSTSSMNMVITPNQGTTLSSIVLQERGNYSLSGKRSSVAVNGQIRVFDMADPIGIEDSAPILTSSDLTINDNGFHNWMATADLDLTSAMWQNTSAINLSINNILEASTVKRFSKAIISKDFSGIQITVANSNQQVPPSTVPVPAAAWLFGSGLLGMVGVSRRRITL